MTNLNNFKLLLSKKLKLIGIKPIQYLIGVIYCFVISYFISLYFSSNILYHSDTFAPIEEIKLLATIKNINLTNIHLARIPSLFPDLTLIYLLIKVFQINDIFSIISYYSIVNSFLLLVSLSFISSLIVNKKLSFLYSSCLISTFSLFLIKKSTFYAEVLAQYLTPLHQGGNIIMTLIGVIILFYLFVVIRSRVLFNICMISLLPAFIGFSIASNKLFVFTYLVPIFLVLIYLETILINKLVTSNISLLPEYKRRKFIHTIILRLRLSIIELISTKKYIRIFLLSLPIFLITFSLQFLLDLQCLDPLSFKFFQPIKELNNLISQDPLLSIFFLTNMGLVIYSFYRIYKKIKVTTSIFYKSKLENLLLFKSELIGSFIGISSLSPLLYIWITNNVISRYLLVLPLFMPLSAFIIIDFTVRNIKAKKINNIITFSLKIVFIGISIYTFNSNIFSSATLNNFTKPRDIFYNAALIQRFNYANDYKQIASLGLEKGLSDFWGSSVSYFGNGEVDVSPILDNGLPNLWSHSIYNFIDNDLDQLKKYNFIYSRDFEFSKSIINIFGNPDEIYKIQDSNSSPILITDLDSNFKNRIILIYKNKDFNDKLNILFKDRVSKGCRNY